MALTKKVILQLRYKLEDTFHSDMTIVDTSIESTVDKEFVIENAYIKIITVNGSKEKIELLVGTYSNIAAEHLLQLKRHSFIPDTTDPSDNFIKQGYEYLKTLPEYATALDC